MKKEREMNETKFSTKAVIYIIILCCIPFLLGIYIQYYIDKASLSKSNRTYITENTYSVNATTYEYGSVVIDDKGNKYLVEDSPEYPDNTKVILFVYGNQTEHIDDDVVVYIEEVE